MVSRQLLCGMSLSCTVEKSTVAVNVPLIGAELTACAGKANAIVRAMLMTAARMTRMLNPVRKEPGPDVAREQYLAWHNTPSYFLAVPGIALSNRAISLVDATAESGAGIRSMSW